MHYLLTIWADESGMADATPEQMGEFRAAYERFGQDAREAGVIRGGEGLQHSQTATVLRLTGGERTLTDGPFAETREQLGGYYLLEVEDLDEALSWAERIPSVIYGGAVELRPVMDYAAVNMEHEGTRG